MNRALKIAGWLWCIGSAYNALMAIGAGKPLVAIAFFISAALAAPPSWHVLARYGVQATRPIKAVAIVGAWLVGVIILLATSPHLPVVPAEGKGPVAEPVAAAPIEGPATCDGIPTTPKDFAVREAAPLHERADAQSDQVSIPFGADQQMRPVSIDPTMPVREMCRSRDWSYVSILQLPSDIGRGRGWVPTAKLRPVSTDKRGRRIYGPADFEWPDGSLRYQKAVLTVVNRIMAQNPKCDAFNSQSLLLDKDRAGALFKVACFGADEQVVDFRPDDATNNRSFVPIDPIDETTARNACEAAAKQRAAHPSTIDISTSDGEFHSYAGGITSYRTTFTAKNSFNLELKYAIQCGFEGAKFTKVDIQETAD